MGSYRRKLELDRQELLLLFLIVLLMSGLMFTFGMLVGYSAKGGATADLSAETSEGAESASAESDSGEVSKKKALRKPASKKSRANKLQKEYREDKQQALVEKALRDSGAGEEPTSVKDMKAHVEAHKKEAGEGRKPASAEKTARRTAPQKEDGQRGIPETVKGLFERKPAATDKYEPTPGTYTVQVASFATREESEAKTKSLRKLGFNEAYVKSIRLSNGEVWYRVSVGSFPSVKWAKKEGEKLVRRKLASDFVIRKVN